MFAVICNGKHFPRKTQTPTELCRFIWSTDFKTSKTTAACAVTTSEGRRLGDGRYCRGRETLAALSRFVDFLSVPSLLSSLFPPFWPRQRHSLLPPLCPCQRHCCYIPCVPVSVTHGLPGESSSSGLSACPFGAGSLYFFTLFLLVRRLSSFILLCCLYNITGSTLKRSVFKKSFKKEAFCSLLLIVKTQMRV